MNRQNQLLNLRNNRLKFIKTSGELPIVLGASLEYTSNQEEENRKITTLINRLDLETLVQDFENLCPRVSFSDVGLVGESSHSRPISLSKELQTKIETLKSLMKSSKLAVQHVPGKEGFLLAQQKQATLQGALLLQSQWKQKVCAHSA